MKRILCLALCSMMLLALVGCGGSSTGGSTSGTASTASTASKASSTKVKGETQTWGDFTILVPTDLTLYGGDAINSNDKTKVRLSNDGMTYINVSVMDEQSINDSIEMTKEINKDCDITAIGATKIGDNTWEGITYESLGYQCTTLKGKVDGQNILVQICGFKYDDDTVKAVLESLKLQ